MEPRFLSVKTAAAYMDCKPSTIRAWIAKGIIPAIRISRREPKGRGRHLVTIRIDKQQLDDFLESRSLRVLKTKIS